MESISQFLKMGGYAAYVWPSYLITALVLTGAVVSSIRFARRQENDLKALQDETKENDGEA